MTLTQILRSRHYLTLNISETARDAGIYNGILIHTYTCRTQGCHLVWSWVTLSELANYIYSIIRSIARPLCDSRVACYPHRSSLKPRQGSFRWTCCMKVGINKLVPGLTGVSMRDPTVISFESIPACDKRTDRRTRRPCLHRALA